MIEEQGRTSVGVLVVPRHQLHGHVVSLREWRRAREMVHVTRWDSRGGLHHGVLKERTRLFGQRLRATDSALSTERRTASTNSTPVMVSFSRRRSMTASREPRRSERIVCALPAGF